VLGVSVEYGRSSRRGLYGLGMDNTGAGLGPGFGIGRLKLGIKRGSKIVFSGAPGRGVLRFWPGDTGTPFIFWPFFVFFRKIDRFRG